MKKIITIAQKELSELFRSPLAYVVLGVTLSIFHFFFFVIIDQNQEATLRDIFHVMEFMFVFIVPILTMKVFAEEKARGTMEFLLTTPTSNTAIVLGKYFGIYIFFFLIVLLTSFYYLILEVFSQVDRVEVLTGYVGVLLEGGFFIALGLMVSSWTSNQMVAAITAYLFLFFLYFATGLMNYLPHIPEEALNQLSTLTHLNHFSLGFVTLSDVTYYLSGIFICLIITRFSIEKRLWA